MGTASRTSSASRSRSPRRTGDQSSRGVPELSRPQRSNMAANTSAASQAQSGITLTPSMTPPEAMPGTSQHPTLQDLRAVANDIKDTFTAAMTDLRQELQAMAGRMQDVEQKTNVHNSVLRKVTATVSTHTMQLRDIQRHVEDLENRGRRHNLRVRGLPESVDNTQLNATVSAIFSQLLESQCIEVINMDRIHRALRPKGRDTDPPRDVICFINDYRLKEDILKQARIKRTTEYEGHRISIYQDLSAITLRHRKDLRPLLEILQSKNIPYRWKFPFALAATNQGRTAILRVPEDLDSFCQILDIPYTPVPNWYSDFPLSNFSIQPRGTDQMETQASHFRRRRSPSTSRRNVNVTPPLQSVSPTSAPLPRRARRDH